MKRYRFRIFNNKNVRRGVSFNDLVHDEEAGAWSQICSDCRRKHNFPEKMLDEYYIDNDTKCGIRNCNNIASFFITFGKEEG